MTRSDMTGGILGSATDSTDERFNGFITQETCKALLEKADSAEITEHFYDEPDQKKRNPAIDDAWAQSDEGYETTAVHARLSYDEHNDKLELDAGLVWYEPDEDDPVRPEGGYSITATFDADTDTADTYSEMIRDEEVSYSTDVQLEGRSGRGMAAGATIGAGAGFATFGPAGAVPWGFIGAVTGDRVSRRLAGERTDLLDLATRIELNSGTYTE